MKDRDNFHVEITDVWANRTERVPYGVLGIEWVCPGVGWGEWQMLMDENGVPHVDTECMDKGDDKRFSKAVLDALLEKMVIDC